MVKLFFAQTFSGNSIPNLRKIIGSVGTGETNYLLTAPLFVIYGNLNALVNLKLTTTIITHYKIKIVK